jgi:hypothetical protein
MKIRSPTRYTGNACGVSYREVCVCVHTSGGRALLIWSGYIGLGLLQPFVFAYMTGSPHLYTVIQLWTVLAQVRTTTHHTLPVIYIPLCIYIPAWQGVSHREGVLCCAVLRCVCPSYWRASTPLRAVPSPWTAYRYGTEPAVPEDTPSTRAIYLPLNDSGNHPAGANGVSYRGVINWEPLGACSATTRGAPSLRRGI